MAVTSNFDKIVLLQDFANYFNRKIFYYAALSDYLANAENYYVRTDINFNPNDGIRTNLDALEYVEDAVGNLSKEFNMKTIDYLLVVDPSNDTIKSRWWVVSITRTRNGLYNLKLKRDTVAEVIDENDFLVNTPVYVEKGHLKDNDPYIVNSENLTFNQIKRGEILLTENKIGGWVVGYMSNDAYGTYNTYKRDNSPAEYFTTSQIATDTGIPADVIGSLDTTPIWMATGRTDILLWIEDDDPVYQLLVVLPLNMDGLLVDEALGSGPVGNEYRWLKILGEDFSGNDENAIAFATTLQQEFEDDLSGYRNFVSETMKRSTHIQNSGYISWYFNEQYQKLMKYQGKILLKDGVYYKIGFKIVSLYDSGETSIGILGSGVYGDSIYFDTVSQNVCDFYNSEGLNASINTETGMYDIESVSSVIQMTLEVIPNTVFENSISNSHNILIDAPYSMFAIPLNGMRYIDSDGVERAIPIADEEVLSCASAIATGLDAKLFDIQILPYCPCMDLLKDNGNKADLRLLTYGKDYDKIIYDDGNGNQTTKGLIFYPVSSTREFIIEKELKASYSPKIESQVSFCRLCSPNYSGVFEFNLAKNNNVNFFYVDFTYKPFNPFIHVVPQFRFLYGGNFLDGRGLLCGGEFSLPIVKDRWTEYELNNKNYNAIFARDIQNMDFRHGQETIKEGFNMLAGSLAAGAAGATAGGKMGGGYGAAAGATLGLGLGLAGGAIDISLGNERRAEEKDYAIDRFNLQLGNIKALPQSLSRISSLTNISKIFPFIEYYSATDEEIAALEEKIRYDGMTVGRIDKILNYKGGNESQYYFKGQMIRSDLENYDEDFYRDLYEELAKGVYI